MRWRLVAVPGDCRPKKGTAATQATAAGAARLVKRRQRLQQLQHTEQDKSVLDVLTLQLHNNSRLFCLSCCHVVK